ncbi:hypothetical protein FRC20_005146 [Serendipita sp. 405]|nr:hypothetical protein FRC15_004546 [Serendipita sp. 397]KAG8867685.1 hypothetical protein FRC20_005146 [Serendipita sp. 405]
MSKVSCKLVSSSGRGICLPIYSVPPAPISSFTFQAAYYCEYLEAALDTLVLGLHSSSALIHALRYFLAAQPWKNIWHYILGASLDISLWGYIHHQPSSSLSDTSSLLNRGRTYGIIFLVHLSTSRSGATSIISPHPRSQILPRCSTVEEHMALYSWCISRHLALGLHSSSALILALRYFLAAQPWKNIWHDTLSTSLDTLALGLTFSVSPHSRSQKPFPPLST